MRYLAFPVLLVFLMTACLSSPAARIKPIAIEPIGHFQTLAIDPENSDILYVGATNGLYRLEITGKQYQSNRLELPEFEVRNIVFDTTAKTRTLYAGTFSSALYRFRESRGRWQVETIDNLPAQGITSLTVDPTQPGRIFATTSTAVYLKAPGSDDFEQLPNLPPDLSLRSLLIDPANPGWLHLQAHGEKYFISEDVGNTWRVDRTPNSYLHSWNVGKAKTSVGANTDQEQTLNWRAIRVLINDLVTTMIFHPNNPKLIHISTHNTGLWTVTRIGNIWEATKINALDESTVTGLALDQRQPARMFAATRDTIYLTNDSGVTWIKLRALPEGEQSGTENSG